MYARWVSSSQISYLKSLLRGGARKGRPRGAQISVEVWGRQWTRPRWGTAWHLVGTMGKRGPGPGLLIHQSASQPSSTLYTRGRRGLVWPCCQSSSLQAWGPWLTQDSSIWAAQPVTDSTLNEWLPPRWRCQLPHVESPQLWSRTGV